MPLGFASLSEDAISEFPGVIVIGDLDPAYALLWDLDPTHEILWDLDPVYELLWDLDPLTYWEDGMPVYTPIDIGDTVRLTAVGVFEGDIVPPENFTLQIKTPDKVQWPDIPGSELTYNAATGRYQYKYRITGAYAQAGDHFYRYKAVTDDDDPAAKWKKLPVRAMPFSET